MPGRQSGDWGIPLWDAIERWIPRELWERYREFAAHDIPLIILEGPGEPRADEARRLRGRISEVLVDKLVRGELIASAIAQPLKETSRRRDIRPELWPLLSFSCKFQLVVGNGLRYGQILIRETSSVRHAAPASRQDPDWPGAAPRRGVRRPGRPSVMPSIEAEMRRRATDGQIEGSLRQEAEVLAIWAQGQFADTPVPQRKSIEKKLGRIYKELKTTKRPDK
jgi:hypothetical protein